MSQEGGISGLAYCLQWVDSRRLAKSYLESVPTSEFGATADVRQAAGYDIWLAAVLPQSATHYRSESGLVRRPWSDIQKFCLNFRNVLK